MKKLIRWLIVFLIPGLQFRRAICTYGPSGFRPATFTSLVAAVPVSTGLGRDLGNAGLRSILGSLGRARLSHTEAQRGQATVQQQPKGPPVCHPGMSPWPCWPPGANSSGAVVAGCGLGCPSPGDTQGPEAACCRDPVDRGRPSFDVLG